MRFLYSASYVVTLMALVGVSFLLFRQAAAEHLLLPIAFGSVYQTVRTLVGISTTGFFVLLMVRHVLLMVIAVLDHAERAAGAGLPDALFLDPMVSIIVPAYNEGRCIEASIRSLLQIDYPRYQVIVVDDGSVDDTLVRAMELVGDHGPAQVAVFTKPNGGKATALNFGIERAAGDLVMTIDSDSVIEPQSLRAMVPYFADGDVGAVAGSVKVVNTNHVWSRLQALEYEKGLNLRRRAEGFIRAVSIVPGPIGVFRKSAMQAVGNYDTDTFAEDCDLTLKLLLAGWRIVYEPGAVARTEAPDGLMALTRQRYRWTRGVLQALNKHRRRMILPRRAPPTAIFMLWYMAFEAVLWPVMTAVSLAFLLLAGLDPLLRPAAVYLWLQLLLLDVAASLYCIAVEGGPLADVLLAPIERLVFQPMLELGKFMAMLEQLVGVHMTWGKLERRGLK